MEIGGLKMRRVCAGDNNLSWSESSSFLLISCRTIDWIRLSSSPMGIGEKIICSCIIIKFYGTKRDGGKLEESSFLTHLILLLPINSTLDWGIDCFYIQEDRCDFPVMLCVLFGLVQCIRQRLEEVRPVLCIDLTKYGKQM